jgi:hypothetical protein
MSQGGERMRRRRMRRRRMRRVEAEGNRQRHEESAPEMIIGMRLVGS